MNSLSLNNTSIFNIPFLPHQQKEENSSLCQFIEKKTSQICSARKLCVTTTIVVEQIKNFFLPHYFLPKGISLKRATKYFFDFPDFIKKNLRLVKSGVALYTCTSCCSSMEAVADKTRKFAQAVISSLKSTFNLINTLNAMQVIALGISTQGKIFIRGSMIIYHVLELAGHRQHFQEKSPLSSQANIDLFLRTAKIGINLITSILLMAMLSEIATVPYLVFRISASLSYGIKFLTTLNHQLGKISQ